MSNDAKPEDAPEEEQGPGSTFLSHLIELRDRLLRIVLVTLVLFLAMVAFANQIFDYFAGPLMSALPEGASLINTKPADIILVPFKLVLLIAFVIALPYILHQVWSFVAPGLYSHEKRLAVPLLVSSVLLFYAGMAFAYFVVLPLIFNFFVGFAPDSVEVTTDIAPYFDFVLMLFLAFGVAFEVPVATVLLVAAGVATPTKLAKMRPYIVVGAFTLGMLLTPPDMISQAMLALPMWILFEIGLVFARMVAKPEQEAEEDDDYESMSDEEMDQELDRIEAEELDASHPAPDGNPGDGAR